MAKLIRVTQQQFMLNGSASHCEQFGAKNQTGSPVPTLDPASIQAGAAFTGNGWLDAVVNANKQPFLEDMNGLFRVAFYQIGQVLQDGIPVWDAGTPYYTGSIVRKDGTFELYGSTTDGNIGNALPSQTNNGNWQYLNPPTVAAGIMQDFAGSSAPFGYLFCDGSVYAQATYPSLYTAIGSAWNIGGEGAGNFRVPDIRGRTTLGAGQGSGLSNRTLAQEFGEETHTLSVPEIPANLTVGDPGHSHGPNPVNPGDYGLIRRSKPGETDTATAGDSGNSGIEPQVVSGPSLPDPMSAIATATTGISAGGGGGAHNNMQPSAVVTKIIKY